MDGEFTLEKLDNMIDPRLAAADAQHAADNAYHAQRRQQQRRQQQRAGRGQHRAAAGSRRAASAPADTRQPRRQRTQPTSSTAQGLGRAAAAAAAAAADRARADMYQEAERAYQAAEREHAQQEQAYAAQAAAEAVAAEKHKWARRREEDHARRLASAPRLAAAVLQQYAAPDPAAGCFICAQAGCTIRCTTCLPALGSVVFCASCDKKMHKNVHMHRRQEYSGSCWKDLPMADAEDGYFFAAVKLPMLLQEWRPISADAFRQAADQYSFCQLDLRLGVQQLNDLACPACAGGTCTMHIDSNMKLFVWERYRELWRQPHFREFFARDADVQLTLNAVDAARSRVGADTVRAERVATADVREDKHCNGVWAAAGDGQQRRMSKQAVTGRCVATDARHGLVKVAANLKGSGERYGYALHLLVYHLETCGQLHMDIMCKWRPWLQRAVLALLQEPPADASAELRARIQQLRQLVTAADNYEGVRMVLSHAHGTLHSLHCQVLWQPGWRPACAKTLGEEGEQFFAYWAKFAFTTRNQSEAGSSDQLHKGALHFNRNKVKKQAHSLVGRQQKFRELLPKAEAKLAAQLQRLSGTSAADRPAVVASMKEALQALASEEVSKRRDGNQQLLDQYSAAVCSRQAHELDAAMNACMARIGMDSASFAAARVIAGLTDPRVAAVQETIDRLNAAAQASRVAAADADAIIKDKFVPALDASIVRLQNVIEGLCHDLKKSESKRDAKAATPKERQGHSQKCKQLVSTLTQRVEQYNILVQEYNKTVQPEQTPDDPAPGVQPWDKARATATLQNVRQHDFSWRDEYSFDAGHPLRKYGVACAVSVCEADNEVSRIKEELLLLPQEMSAHLSYYRSLADRLTQLQTLLAADGELTVEQLQAAGVCALQGLGRYQPSVESIVSDAAVRSGVLTLVGLAKFEVQQLLSKAIAAFGKAGLPGMTAEAGVGEGQQEGEGQGGEEEEEGGDSEDGDMVAPADDGGV